MVTRIRKGARPHVYLREWRKHRDLKATAMAERLGIERESYYRLEREPYKLSLGEVIELADALGIDPKQMFAPPDAPESLDLLVKDATEPQRTKAIDLVKVLLGKAG
jgi:transcriptional regulator with XRE-family HTH domain